ncbi:unnamed protein product [Durusdinium trenchii]|uniref:Uncharacterized protein n=2 Tax=Durusdinium trenchii TaxID=1381693 RepID=A0ABP0NJD8_9DINO
MGGKISALGGPSLSNLLQSSSKEDHDSFDRAFAKFPATPSRTWGFQAKTDAIYANDSWLSTQKRIRLSDINRFLELRPYPGKPAGGKIEFPGDYNMVWGNPEWLIPEEQNYNLSFSRQQHHDMGGAAVAAVLLGDVRLAPSRTKALTSFF